MKAKDMRKLLVDSIGKVQAGEMSPSDGRNIVGMANQVNLSVQTELKKMKLEDLIGQSNYYKGQMEGIVMKNYARKAPIGNHQIFAKIVADIFKENNRAVFGSIKSANTDTIKIVDEYCTDARIRKKILEQTKEFSQPLDLKLMSKVPSVVIKDIIIEGFDGIFSNYKFVDFKQMKQLVAKRCLRVIREEMAKKVK